MKISVIVPYEGYYQYLKDCLESLSEQENVEIETLLVGSQDDQKFQQLVDTYKDKISLKVIPCSIEEGVAKKRNLGLENATGDYIYFIDSDDYIMPQTLSYLLQDAMQQDLDLVVGRRWITWFKKQVFETMGDEKNEELNLKDKDDDRNHKFLEKDYSDIDDSDEQRRIDLLIRAKKGIRNISVLNILIKRTLIEENHLRFNEDFIYYSDLPFVEGLVMYGHKIDFNDKTLYAKRKHNDPINTPALSQIKDETKFDEFINVYKYAISLVDKESRIRYYLDSKMIKYYSNFFAKKIRRSKDDFWRDERFDQMSILMQDVRDDLLKNMSHYQRKMVKLARNHDLHQTQKVIAKHLAKNKMKKILKNKNEINKYLYRHKYINEAIEENWIMFETFMGKSYADSPKYIYEYLAKNYPGKYKFIWVLNDPKEKLPYEGIIVKRFTKKYAYYLAKSKYFVFNIRQPLWFRKREGQVFLETWHGTPLKRLAFDQEEVTAASPTYKSQFYRQKQEWDYLIAANKFSSDIFKSCFMYTNGTMLEIGYPRNDLLYAPNKDQIALDLKKKLHIPLDKKTILYAPTWRDDEYYGKGQYKFKLKLDLEMMKEELGDEYVILLRTHHYIADALDVTGVEDFAYNLSKYDDITEIYLISDICITDYSSVFFDYANLKRPMLFYTYDIDKYRDVLRGFYIDMEKELPGPLVYSTKEVIDQIKHLDEMNQKYAQRYEVFYDKFCSIDDGNASQRAVEAVFK